MYRYPEIIFDAERMKYPNTGIFHYCDHLSHALLQQQQQHTNRLGLYIPPSVAPLFPPNIYHISQKSRHRFYRPFVRKFKVWHVTNQLTNYYPWASRQKVALTVHDLNFLYEKKSLPKQKQYLAEIQKKISRADAVFAISKFVRDEIINNLKIDEYKLKVIYNGCNISANTIPAKPAHPIHFPFIFSIGAISAKKNFHVLCEALVNSELHFVFAGVIQNKEYFNKIYEVAKELGVEKKVHYLGQVSEAEKYWLMQHAALFAFPSLAEGFGLPVIEAMRFGRPVILSKATSLPEIGGEVAYYLNSFEGDHIREVAEFVLANHNAIRVQETIKWSYQFDWQNAGREYWDVYDRLCG